MAGPPFLDPVRGNQCVDKQDNMSLMGPVSYPRLLIENVCFRPEAAI